MKKFLPDLQNRLFEEMDRFLSLDIKSKDMEMEIKRALAFNEMAKTAVANGALMAKCADLLYGIPVSDEVPLIPKAKEDTFIVDKKRRALLAVPRDDGNGGFKRHRENPI